MQRLAQNDPSELYLSRGERVRHICLPGEETHKIYPPELRKFYTNGLFDPIRMNRDALERMKGDMGAFGYAGQILQDPIPLGGSIFKAEQLYEVDFPPSPKEFKKIVRFWDKAASKNYGDWTVGVKMGLHRDGSFWILDIKRGQWATDQREKVILDTALQDGPKVRIGLEREPGSSGIDSAKETIKRLAGFPVEATPATGRKELRADTFSVQVNSGNVRIVRGPYLKEYLEEISYFPNSRYDDQVDASSGAFAMLIKQSVRLGVL